MLQDLMNNPDSEMTLVCTVGSIGPVQTTKNGKAYQVVRLQDGTNVADAKIFQGNGLPMQPSMSGQTATFKLKNSTYRGQASIAGYWQAGAKTLQAPQQALNNLTPPDRKENGTIERQVCWKDTPDELKVKFIEQYDTIEEAWDDLSNWFMTGKWTSQPEEPEIPI